MVGQRLVGLRIHAQRYEIPCQGHCRGAISGAVRDAAGYPFRPLRGAAEPGEHGDRRQAQPGHGRPGAGAPGGEFPPPASRGPRDGSVFLRKEFGSGIIPERLDRGDSRRQNPLYHSLYSVGLYGAAASQEAHSLERWSRRLLFQY
jgi:hypothetical protein